MAIRRSLQAEFIETSTAKEAVLFANSPAYLLDRLRKDTSTAYVAQEFSTKEILELLTIQCSKPLTTALDWLHVYVLLVALSLKDDLREYQEQLNQIDMSRLQWGDAIRKRIISERVPTVVSNVRYEKEFSSNSEIHTTTNVAPPIIITDGEE